MCEDLSDEANIVRVKLQELEFSWKSILKQTSNKDQLYVWGFFFGYVGIFSMNM
jgi:hypothetical protein